MSADFMAFWKLSTLDQALKEGKSLDYAASNQYKRVSVGDTVWIVTVRNGRLRLVGRIVVDQIVDRDTAAKLLSTDKLWPADCYILPTSSTTQRVVDIDVHHRVSDLCFGGSSNKLVQDEEGRVSGSRLQTMRKLAGNSAEILADCLQLSSKQSV